MADFLLEIGLDEIPARMIAQAEAELGRRVHDLLARERLLGPKATLTTFSTPRRLAVLVQDVLAGQADTEEQLTGPSWKVAFKDGAPTAAAEAFAKKAGVPVAALEKVTNAKGEYVGTSVKRQGRETAELLAGELPREVLGLYWAKNMYWRAGRPERFVRPIRWIVALLDSAVVPVEIAGIAAGNTSRGHRILHGSEPIVIATPGSYAEALRKAFVVVDVAERRQTIRKALDKATRTVPGARWREDEPLIETVVHLTEWPSVILGNFEVEYLALPEEVLVTVMRDHQKYFAVEGADGKLLPHFLTVLNIAVDEEGEGTIRHGNQKVLRARFKDARFFWDFDQKIPLADRVESLKNVTFQKELGSYYWKTEENLRIAEHLADHLDRIAPIVAYWEDHLNSVAPNAAAVRASNTTILGDRDALRTAVRLAKTDLTTELVKEFTELQGVIGGIYAEAQGLGKTVGRAIYEQYIPASVEDAIPTTIEGQVMGLVDRIQTITEMFGIGNAPTGSKDPFALRRAANSIVKILAESRLPLRLSDLLDAAGGNQGQVANFLGERLGFYLKDVRGFAYDVVSAVLAAGADNVCDAIARAEALTEVRGSEDFTAISIAFKRIKNILRQAKDKGYSVIPSISEFHTVEAEHLHSAVVNLEPMVAELTQRQSFSEALALIATLRPAVDSFFDKVMVLDPDPAIRGAHLGLIDKVLRGFSGIADFSEIVTG